MRPVDKSSSSYPLTQRSQFICPLSAGSMETSLYELPLPPVLHIPCLGAPSPAQCSAHTKHLASFCVKGEPSALPTRMGFLTEKNSPVLIFKEKRNALQARKLGIWEGFQPGDFQQDLKKPSPSCIITERGEEVTFTHPFPSSVLVTTEEVTRSLPRRTEQCGFLPS